jgi:hypothetical protein
LAAESGSRRAEITHKSEEVSSYEVLGVLLRDADFSCNVDVLCGGQSISELQFFFIKNICFPAVNFFQFSSPNPWIRIGIETNVAPQHCRRYTGRPRKKITCWLDGRGGKPGPLQIIQNSLD